MRFQLPKIMLGLVIVMINYNMAQAAKGPPTIKQCKTKWVLTSSQSLAFGGFTVDGAGTIFMDSSGSLTTSGVVGFSSLLPVSTFAVTIDNTKSAICGTYGFTLSWNPGPTALTGPGIAMSLNNVHVTGPGIGAPSALPLSLSPASLPITLVFQGELGVSVPQTDGDYLSPLFTLNLDQDGTSQTLSSTASATAYSTLSVAESAAMNFGTIAGGATAGTIILSPLGVISTTGDAQALPASGAAAAQFTITGSDAARSITVVIDGTSAQLDHSAGGAPMTLAAFTNNGLPTDTGTGSVSFQVGATLSVSANQPAGTYSTATGSGAAYTVTVNYN